MAAKKVSFIWYGVHRLLYCKGCKNVCERCNESICQDCYTECEICEKAFCHDCSININGFDTCFKDVIADADTEEFRDRLVKLMDEKDDIKIKCEELESKCKAFESQCKALEEENHLLKLKLEFMPGGSGYEEAKDDFEKLRKNE